MKKVTFDLDDLVYDQVEEQAEKNERSVSAELRIIIKEYFK